MKKVYLTAGHNKARLNPVTKAFVGGDPGAVANGFTEADLAIEIRDLTTTELKNLGVEVINDENSTPLQEVLNLFRPKVKSGDIFVEFHWNAATPAATGTEILVRAVPAASAEERKLAKEIVDTLAKVLKIRNRGVKTEADSQHKRLAIMRMPTDVKVALVEVCFITNKSDMNSYQKNKLTLAKEIAKVIKNNL